jgi:hypothetical protein
LKTVSIPIQRATVGIIGVFIGLPRTGVFSGQCGQPLLRDRLLVVLFAHHRCLLNIPRHVASTGRGQVSIE